MRARDLSRLPVYFSGALCTFFVSGLILTILTQFLTGVPRLFDLIFDESGFSIVPGRKHLRNSPCVTTPLGMTISATGCICQRHISGKTRA